MNIEIEMVNVKPDYRPLGRTLLEAVRKFYEDPENEKAFQEWKRKREAEKGA